MKPCDNHLAIGTLRSTAESVKARSHGPFGGWNYNWLRSRNKAKSWEEFRGPALPVRRKPRPFCVLELRLTSVHPISSMPPLFRKKGATKDTNKHEVYAVQTFV